MDTFPSIAPTYDGTGDAQSTARVLESRLGDGYVQAVAQGINNIEQTYPLVWAPIPLADATSIVSFLESQAGYKTFLWQPPWSASALKWRCKQWGRRELSPTHASVSATFERSYNL